MKKIYSMALSMAVALTSVAAPVRVANTDVKVSGTEKTVSKTAATVSDMKSVVAKGENKQFKVSTSPKKMRRSAQKCAKMKTAKAAAQSDDIRVGQRVMLVYDKDYQTYTAGYATAEITADRDKYVINQFIFSDALPVNATVEPTDYEGYDRLVIPSQTPLYEYNGVTYSLMLFDYGEDGNKPTVYRNDIPFLIDLETGDMMLEYSDCGIAWLDLNSYSGNWIMEPLMYVPNAHLVGDDYIDNTVTEPTDYPMVALGYESGDIELYNFAGMPFSVYMEYYPEEGLFVAENAIVDYYTYNKTDYPVYAYNYTNDDESVVWLMGDVKLDDKDNLEIDLGTFMCALELGWLSKMDNAVITFSDGSAEPGEDVMTGDANGDGVINVSDVVATVNCILGSPADNFNADAADVNGDGAITISDVVAIVNILLGK